MTDDNDRQGESIAQDAPVKETSDYRRFFEELRRRRVIRVGLVYLVVAWLIIQVSQATFPALLLPSWSVTLVVALLIFGFPLALVLSWAYQVETHGTDHSATTIHYIVDKNRKIDFIVIAVLVTVIAILTYQRINDDGEIADDATDTAMLDKIKSTRPSIAVLPFVNMSDDPENAYFSDGLTEEILNLLVRMRVIDVASRTSSFYFKGKDVDIKTVAEHLGVSNVLEGSVRREGDRIRITAQLINAATGFHLWSDSYDRQMKDIFTIQDNIARQVVNALQAVLTSDSSAILDRAPTSSVDAYEYYLLGRNYLRGEHSETRLQSALSLFERAIDLDPEFAEAHAGLCDTYLAFYRRSRSIEFFEYAERACHRGLTLDNDAVDVYVALGNLYRYSGQHQKALAQYHKATDLNDNDIDAYLGIAESYKEQNLLEQAAANYQRVIDMQPGYWRGYSEMGSFLYYAGQLEESVRNFQKAISLAPDNATGYLNLGASYYLMGDFESAAAAWTRSLQLEPSPSGYMNVGSSYFFLGRFDEAADMYRKASELSPNDFEIWGALGDALSHVQSGQPAASEAYAKAVELGDAMLRINASDAQTMALLSQYHAKLGDTERAMALVEQAESLQPQNMYVHYFAAIAHTSAGHNDAALAAIEEAVKLGYPVTLLAMDAGLSNLAGEQRFREIVSRSVE